MAIIRVSGGNSGIAEYLKTGIKQDREFSRDQLDKRITLSGDLDLTDSIINSIPNKKQDRYLHITISFKEDVIGDQVAKEVLDQYLNDLIGDSYRPDEINVYAELHNPKIKSYIDKKTGEHVERKPHIHLVIPKVNLYNGKAIEPTGKYTQNEKFFEAIQEKINQDFKLSSPRDNVRVTDDNYAKILERTKNDSFNVKNGKERENIHSDIVNYKINNVEEFEKYLKLKYTDFKIRNKGTEKEYYAVKKDNESNYINLKSPLFSKKYIESRSLSLDKLQYKDIEKTVNEWKNNKSKEIKYINKSKILRDKYKELSKDKKPIFLNKIEREHYEHESIRHGTNSRERSEISRNPNFRRENNSQRSFGMSEMLLRKLDSNITAKLNIQQRGGERVIRNNSKFRKGDMLVRENELPHLGDGSKGQFDSLRLRWSARDTNRLVNKNHSSEIESIIDNKKSINRKNNDETLEQFKVIRKNLDAKFLLAMLNKTHGLDIDKHNVTYAKDGSSRISYENRNLNVSDFLTKGMSFSWEEAKNYLIIAYEKQSNKLNLSNNERDYIEHEKLNVEKTLIKGETDLNFNLNKIKKEIELSFNNEKYSIIKDKGLKYSEKKALLSINAFNKVRNNSLLKEYEIEKRVFLKKSYNEISDVSIVNNLINRGDQMAIDLTSKINENKKEINGIEPEFKSKLTFASTVADIKQKEEWIENTRKRLDVSDLTPYAQRNGNVNYKTSLLNTSFTDEGNKISFKRFPNKDEIAIGLELAATKYGNTLRLTGTPAFKNAALQAAAEKNLNISFSPKEMQEKFEAIKNERDNSIKNVLLKDIENPKLNKLDDLDRNKTIELGKELSKSGISFIHLASESSKTNESLADTLVKLKNNDIKSSHTQVLGLEYELDVKTKNNANEIKINGMSPSDFINDQVNKIPIDAPESIKKEIITFSLLSNEKLEPFSKSEILAGLKENSDLDISFKSIVNENGRNISDDIKIELHEVGEGGHIKVSVNNEPLTPEHFNKIINLENLIQQTMDKSGAEFAITARELKENITPKTQSIVMSDSEIELSKKIAINDFEKSTNNKISHIEIIQKMDLNPEYKSQFIQELEKQAQKDIDKGYTGIGTPKQAAENTLNTMEQMAKQHPKHETENIENQIRSTNFPVIQKIDIEQIANSDFQKSLKNSIPALEIVKKMELNSDYKDHFMKVLEKQAQKDIDNGYIGIGTAKQGAESSLKAIEILAAQHPKHDIPNVDKKIAKNNFPHKSEMKEKGIVPLKGATPKSNDFNKSQRFSGLDKTPVPDDFKRNFNKAIENTMNIDKKIKNELNRGLTISR